MSYLYIEWCGEQRKVRRRLEGGEWKVGFGSVILLGGEGEGGRQVCYWRKREGRRGRREEEEGGKEGWKERKERRGMEMEPKGSMGSCG